MKMCINGQARSGNQISIPRTWARCSVNKSAPAMIRNPMRTRPAREARKLPCGWPWCSECSCDDMKVLLFDNKAAAEHPHGTGESEFARFFRKEFDGDRLSCGKFSAFLKIRED